MTAALLDVNVLIALLWSGHSFHAAAITWFAEHRASGWATCPLSQAGFVRLYSQPQVVGAEISVQEALRVLEENIREPDHVFWPLETSIAQLLPEIRQRIIGHQQLTDALLLDLAIRNGGKLVTLDRRVTHLLPRDSGHHSAIEVIPTE